MCLHIFNYFGWLSGYETTSHQFCLVSSWWFCITDHYPFDPSSALPSSSHSSSLYLNIYELISFRIYPKLVLIYSFILVMSTPDLYPQKSVSSTIATTSPHNSFTYFCIFPLFWYLTAILHIHMHQNCYKIVPCDSQEDLEEAALIIPSHQIAHIQSMMNIKLYLDTTFQSISK